MQIKYSNELIYGLTIVPSYKNNQYNYKLIQCNNPDQLKKRLLSYCLHGRVYIKAFLHLRESFTIWEWHVVNSLICSAVFHSVPQCVSIMILILSAGIKKAKNTTDQAQ